MKKVLSFILLSTFIALGAQAQSEPKKSRKQIRREKKAKIQREIKARNPLFSEVGAEKAVDISTVSLKMNVKCHDLDIEPGEEHIVCMDQNLKPAIAKKLEADVISLQKLSETEINSDGYKTVSLKAVIAR